MTILAIDPGKRIGYALFTDAGEEIERGVVQFDDWFKNFWSDGLFRLYDSALEFKEDHDIYQLVIEGYRHDPRVGQGGSLHEASQIIGSVKMMAALARVPLEVQFSRILPVAQIIAGYKPPVTKTGNKKHLPDEDSAYLHGMYWLRAQGII